MEIFELKYIDKDEEYIVQVKERDSMYYVMLPENEISEVGKVKEIVATDGKMWQFYSRSAKGKDDYCLKVALMPDGTIQYESNTTEGVVTLNDKFDPLLDNVEFPYDIASKLHQLKVQLNEILLLRQQLKDARRELLELRLRRLGYIDVKDIRDEKTLKYTLGLLKDCPSYIEMYEILDDLETYEDYIEVAGFSRREYPDKSKMTEVDIVYSIPSEEDRTNLMDLINKIREKTQNEENDFFDRIDMILGRKLGLVEGYGTRKPKEFGMSFPEIMSRNAKDWEKYSEYVISQAQAYLNGEQSDEIEPQKEKNIYNSVLMWKMYTQALSLIAKIYLGLNKDLLDENTSQEIDDLTGIYGKGNEEYSDGEELRMLLGKVVNMDDLISLATYSENIAVCIMNIDFLKMLDEIVARDQEQISAGLEDSIQELKDHSLSIIRDRLEHIMFHKEAQRLKREGGRGNWPGKPKNDETGNRRGNYDNNDDWEIR